MVAVGELETVMLIAPKPLWRGHNSIIKSMQDVTVTFGTTDSYKTQALSQAVDPNYSVMIYRGQRMGAAKNERSYHMGRLQLLDANTAEAETWVGTTSDRTGEVARTYHGRLVEFQPWAITYREQGIRTIAGNSLGGYAATGQSLATGRHAVFHQGQMFEGASQSTGAAFGRVYYASGLGIGCFRSNTQSNWQLKCGYTAVEFAPGIVKAMDVIGAQIAASATTDDRVITASGTFDRNLTWPIWAGSMCGGGFQADLGAVYMSGNKAYHAQRNNSPATDWTYMMYFLEFEDRWISSIQHGINRIASGSTTHDDTITDVGNTAKTLVNYYGQASDNPFGNIDYTMIENSLQSATAERCARNAGYAQYVESGYSAVTFR